jgi:hypothetical protein
MNIKNILAIRNGKIQIEDIVEQKLKKETTHISGYDFYV